MKKTGIILGAIIVAGFGVVIGLIISGGAEEYNEAYDNNMIIEENNIEVIAIETSNIEEEKTTPNTLVIYKTYYTKCDHYVQEYNDIDASLVNLTEEEIKEKCRGWRINKFSSKEIELSREQELFCGQHYKLKLENKTIVIYSIDENGVETEYEYTGITTEYLTDEDILKLTEGIYVFGKENLTSTIEDYE